jgi:chitin deacetylase
MGRTKQIHKHAWKKDLAIAISGALLLVVLSSFLITSHSYQILGPYASRVKTTEKIVALTFDDGPLGKHEAEVLSTLKQYNAKATFYLIGKQVNKHPEAARKLAQSGNEIGNHGYTHRSLVFIPYKTITREIELTDQAIRTTGYDGPITFRPPYGHKYLGLPYYLASHKRESVLWSLNPDDIFTKAEDMSRYIEDNVRPGDIIILHIMEDHRSEQRKALKQFLPALEQQGYRFVTVSELLSSR